MTMVSSGPISLGGTATSGGLNQSVNVELGRSGTASINMNESAVRTLAGAGGSGTQYSMSSFYGKSNVFTFTISTNQTNANLRTLAVNAGWNQSTAVNATVASGVYIYSTSTGTPGLTIDGSWPGGVTLTNSGNILGMGGAGVGFGANGNAGGNAISLGVNVTIVNNGYIAGGGGSGAGPFRFSGASGGGAGGGVGGTVVASPSAAGGAGGGPGSSGSNGASVYISFGKYSDWINGGGGGGRVLPGTGGATSGSGSNGYGRGGGAGGGGSTGESDSGGGAGGSGGAAGSNAANVASAGGGGGGWGAAGGNSTNGGTRTGGSGGKAIALNGYTATRSGSGTTYGSVS